MISNGVDELFLPRPLMMMNIIQCTDGKVWVERPTETCYLQITPTEITTIERNLRPQTETRATTNALGIIGILELLGLNLINIG
jgi:hypothetical protein